PADVFPSASPFLLVDRDSIQHARARVKIKSRLRSPTTGSARLARRTSAFSSQSIMSVGSARRQLRGVRIRASRRDRELNANGVVALLDAAARVAQTRPGTARRR